MVHPLCNNEVGVAMERCVARDGMGQRCVIEGPHEEVVNSKGQRAVAHNTLSSLWSVPVHDLQVATAMPKDPRIIGSMLDRARHATPEDVVAGGANNEEELLACLRLGFMRGAAGGSVGTNVLDFTIWPNGHRAFNAGWDFSKQQDVSRIIAGALPT